MFEASRHDTKTAIKARAQTMYIGAYMVTYTAMYMALYMVMRADVRVRLVGHRNRSIVGQRNNLVAVDADFGSRGRNLGFDARNLGFGVRNLGFLGRNLGLQNVTSVTDSTPIRTYVVDRGYEPDFVYALHVRGRARAHAQERKTAHIKVAGK